MTYLSAPAYSVAQGQCQRYSACNGQPSLYLSASAAPERHYISNLEVKLENNNWDSGRARDEAPYVATNSPPESDDYSFNRKLKDHPIGDWNGFCNRLTSTYVFSPAPFLRPDRPTTQFVGEAAEIEQYVREAFQATTGNDLPNDIEIRVCSPFELKRIHAQFGGTWSQGIQGFAVNRCGKGVSEVFVKENFLDALLLVIGHELGHVLTAPLPSQRDEEAKAFAFEMAWLRQIQRENIAGLSRSIVLDRRPAENGLHNVAFSFIYRLLEQGREAFEVYLDLVRGALSLEQRLEAVPA